MKTVDLAKRLLGFEPNSKQVVAPGSYILIRLALQGNDDLMNHIGYGLYNILRYDLVTSMRLVMDSIGAIYGYVARKEVHILLPLDSTCHGRQVEKLTTLAVSEMSNYLNLLFRGIS